MLKWAVADGHDSGLIAGCYADHTLHLLPTLQTHCCWETQCISLVGCHRVFEKDSGECCEHQTSQQQKKTLSQIFVVFKTNVKTVWNLQIHNMDGCPRRRDTSGSFFDRTLICPSPPLLAFLSFLLTEISLMRF